jgi:hypothetical protein
MALNKAVKKAPKAEPLGIEESNLALKWLLGIAAKDTPSGAEASKVVKLIKNMSSVLQWQLMEELKASSDHLDVALAEVAKFPPDGAEARLGTKLFESSLAVVEFLRDTSLRLPFSTRRFKADVEMLYGSMKKRDVGSKYLPVSTERLKALQFPAPQVLVSGNPVT